MFPFNYIGAPSPNVPVRRSFGPSRLFLQIWLKREELAHTGAHKINNAVGQALLAKRIGKNRIIAETGAGQHGVATATVCALLGMECVIYMGAVDCERQKLNVFRMKMLGAKARSFYFILFSRKAVPAVNSRVTLSARCVELIYRYSQPD